MDVVKTVDKEMEFRLQLLNKAREVLVNMVVQDWWGVDLENMLRAIKFANTPFRISEDVNEWAMGKLQCWCCSRAWGSWDDEDWEVLWGSSQQCPAHNETVEPLVAPCWQGNNMLTLKLNSGKFELK